MSADHHGESTANHSRQCRRKCVNPAFFRAVYLIDTSQTDSEEVVGVGEENGVL